MCTNNCLDLIVNILYITNLYCFLPILGTLLVQGFIFERGPTILKFLKNTICLGLCKLKCTEKRFIPFTPLHFLPEFVPLTEFKGRPEDAKWNVLNHTSFRNYAPGDMLLRINHHAQIFLTRPRVWSCERHGCQPAGKDSCRAVNIWVTRVELRGPNSFCLSRTPVEMSKLR